MTKVEATIIMDDPIITVLGEMALNHEGVMEMARWVQKYRPQCVPEGGFSEVLDLVPHGGWDIDPTKLMTEVETPWPDGTGATGVRMRGTLRKVTDNELLCELAGRKCYDSFAEAGAKRTNGEYLRSMWQGRIPHRSTGYHAKMSFFFAHVSRRVSHELIRNYVGADRDEEGNPSQESTRFTHHPGVYIAHPSILGQEYELDIFRQKAQRNYEEYVATIERKIDAFRGRTGQSPKGLDRKRIYESTSNDLMHSCGTSFIWTTNPMAITKFLHERDNDEADMEMARFARAWKRVVIARWPNLFSPFFS
jgi:thymidylate synthase ThyX